MLKIQIFRSKPSTVYEAYKGPDKSPETTLQTQNPRGETWAEIQLHALRVVMGRGFKVT